jgi:RecA/RadA recombinase
MSQINIIGDAPSVKRLVTGLYSFDKAFENKKGEIGLPIGVGVEIHGLTHCGKSTITYGLAGLIATSQGKKIALADLEGFDPEFLVSVLENSGYSGDVQYIQEEKDEETLNRLISFVYDFENYGVCILDSVAALSPIPEKSGSVGEANMGARAFRMAQFSRKCLPIIREEKDSPTILMVNHMYPKIGGLPGTYTIPGGEVKKFLESVSIRVKRVYFQKKYAEYPDGSYVVEGKVIKNRWGFKHRTFWLFVLSGKGIHKGLTSVYDGFRLGLVKKKDKSLAIGDEKFGTLPTIVKQAQKGNEEFFEPFYKLLEEYENGN